MRKRGPFNLLSRRVDCLISFPAGTLGEEHIPELRIVSIPVLVVFRLLLEVFFVGGDFNFTNVPAIRLELADGDVRLCTLIAHPTVGESCVFHGVFLRDWSGFILLLRPSQDLVLSLDQGFATSWLLVAVSLASWLRVWPGRHHQHPCRCNSVSGLRMQTRTDRRRSLQRDTEHRRL